MTISVWPMLPYFFDRVENIVVNGENAGYECIKKGFFPEIIKSQHYVVKNKTSLHLKKIAFLSSPLAVSKT